MYDLEVKILYKFIWSGDPKAGVPTKILNQVEIWRKLGTQVELIVVCPRIYEIEWRQKANSVFAYRNPVEQIYHRSRLSFSIILTRRKWVIYRRYGVFLLTELITMLTNRTVIEFNTNNDFYYKERSIFIYFYHKVQETFVNKFATCGIAVTNEIKELQKNRIKNKTAVFTNSIQINNKTSVFSRKWERVRILFLIGGEYSWNGMERLVQLAKNTQSYDYYIIGPLNWQIKNKNIFYLGPKYQAELDLKMEEMDFGLSNLDMERIGLTEFAPLKNRKYLEIGLPILSPYRDSGIDNDANFFFLLPFDIFQCDVTKLTLDSLDIFVEKWKGFRVPTDQIQSMSASKIERLRLEFIAKSI